MDLNVMSLYVYMGVPLVYMMCTQSC